MPGGPPPRAMSCSDGMPGSPEMKEEDPVSPINGGAEPEPG